MYTAKYRRCAGFTLIEIAIVFVIISILAAVVLRSQSVIDQATVVDTIASVKDLQAAVGVFKQRYRYLPGDFPVDQTNPEIRDVQPACRIAGANAGNGNGSIEPGESACATEHLIRAELIKGDPLLPISNRQGKISLVRVADSGALTAYDARVQNVIVLTNISCTMALEIDRKIDDANLSTGTVRASKDNAFCTASANDRVQLVAFSVAL